MIGRNRRGDIVQEDKFILLVDDNEDDIFLTLHAFRQRHFPYRIDVAHDGIEALEYILCTGRHAGRDKSQRPSLILLDIKMPRMNGLEVLKRMRSEARLNDLPAVIFTSSDEHKDKAEAMALGANLYIRKPESYQKFTEVIFKVEDLLSSRQPLPFPSRI